MKVLVADDHSLFRDGIVSLLEAAGFDVIAQVADGDSAVAAFRDLRPDLVLLDVAMPKTDGLQALSQIKKLSPETKVVMLTVSEDDEHLLAAAEGGANGYLLKSLDADEFLGLLNGIQEGEAPMTRKTAARLLERLSSTRDGQSPETPRFTEREAELLQLVAQGLSNKGIGRTLQISENTVKYHMKNILQKMNASNRTEAVTRAIRSGLIDPQAGASS